MYGYEIHDKIRNLVCEISNKNFVLFGYFNYRGIDWAVNCHDSNATVEARLFLDCVSDCFITQHVDFLTTDKSILDLILVAVHIKTSLKSFFALFEKIPHNYRE